jgi:methylaspartate ammonia-lyase
LTKLAGRIALVTGGADQILAKTGMGVDEGLMIVGNEMVRTAALARRRSALVEI